MNLYIRADANTKIGAGHVMRCLALSQTWQDVGGHVTFISHCEGETLKKRIQNEGFKFIAVDHVCPDSSDLMHTLSILENNSADQRAWLVLDGYHFTTEYQYAIRNKGIPLLVIDDMNHLLRYHADILLNQNIHAPDLKYCCDEDTTLLRGTRYVLLRREFLNYLNFKRKIPRRAKNILITFGGADPDNITLKVLEAFVNINEPDIELKIIIGPNNPHQESIRRFLVSFRIAAEIQMNPNNMPELMAWADMAVSAAGSTCWESAFMGLPNVVLVLAQNQAAIAESLGNQGFVLNLGLSAECSKEKISTTCQTLINDSAKRSSLSEQSAVLINGQGSNHVIKTMIRNNLKLRDVTDLDRELIWQWANDEDTRLASYSQAYISWNEHTQWFDSVQKWKNHKFYIAVNESDGPVGQIRFALEGDDAIVSFSVSPDFRRKGYGKEILVRATRKLFNETNIKQIFAYIKSENSQSLTVFKNAGFQLVEEVVFSEINSFKMILRRPSLI